MLEVAHDAPDKLWIRGGFPDSFLAADGGSSLGWRQNFIRTCLERDVPQLGPRIPAETLRRFRVMLAHTQGGLLNAASLARGLDVDGNFLYLRPLPQGHGSLRYVRTGFRSGLG